MYFSIILYNNNNNKNNKIIFFSRYLYHYALMKENMSDYYNDFD